MGAPNCDAAISAITTQITDRDAYAEPDMSTLPTPQGTTVTVDSCQFAVTGGPRLGTFTVAKQDQGWEIVGYMPAHPCSAASNGGALPATEAPIPTR